VTDCAETASSDSLGGYCQSSAGMVVCAVYRLLALLLASLDRRTSSLSPASQRLASLLLSCLICGYCCQFVNCLMRIIDSFDVNKQRLVVR